MQSVNPATEQAIKEYPDHSADQVHAYLQRAANAFPDWRETELGQRCRLIRRAGEVLRDRQQELAEMMTQEMGKPIKQSNSEVEKCRWVCEYYADHAERFLTPRDYETDATRSLVRFDPLGPILAIMPWNFPFWQVFRFAAPTLTAGNVGLLKHARNVPGCALLIESVFADAGYPEGVMTTLLASSKEIPSVLESPLLQAVSLTGSEKAGRAVAATAGEHIKKCVLELGGSDPFIVLADADIEQAAKQAAQSRCLNSGQSCIAAKRFIVEEPVSERFIDAFVAAMESQQVGDPSDPASDIGPLARKDLADDLHDQVERSIAAGAKPLTGGKPLDRAGFYYPPTVLAEVTPEMAVFTEETFGPVAAVIRAKDAANAIALANQSSFGLGANLWTADTDRALEFAARIEAGAVFINEFVKSDPRLPFGGVKRSGFGRELSEFGIHEFVNIKTVQVA